MHWRVCSVCVGVGLPFLLKMRVYNPSTPFEQWWWICLGVGYVFLWFGVGMRASLEHERDGQPDVDDDDDEMYVIRYVDDDEE